MQYYTTDTVTALIKKQIKETKKKKDFTDHYHYVVSTLYIKSILDKRFTKESFIPINFYLLKTIISEQQIKTITSFLINNNIIECNKTYKAGEYSLGYRLTILGREGNWKQKQYKDKLLIKKLTMKKESTENNLTGGYQIVKYWSNELKIDETKAKKYAGNHMRQDQDKFEAATASIKQFNNKFAVKDDKGNRLHTNLTNVSGDLRQFLSIDGLPLHLCDIKNSQPLFLYCAMLERGTIPAPELALYKELVESGLFYEYLANKIGMDMKTKEDRKKVKNKVFITLFFDRNREGKTDIETAFSNIFPTIYSEIRVIKEKDYNQMAIMLQKIESDFVFKLVDKIDAELKHVAPLVTIHDAICSTEDNIYIIQQLMEAEAMERYGVKMGTNVEKF